MTAKNESFFVMLEFSVKRAPLADPWKPGWPDPMSEGASHLLPQRGSLQLGQTDRGPHLERTGQPQD